MDRLTKNIGELLKNARKLRGMTQNELGDLIGAKKAYISAYENGNISLSNAKLTEIAGHLKFYIDVTLTPMEGHEEIDL